MFKIHDKENLATQTLRPELGEKKEFLNAKILTLSRKVEAMKPG